MKFLLIGLLALTSAYGFERPESVYVHGKKLYVSNMSGPGNLKDGVGWISIMDKTGKVVTDKWVDGLNAPKGLGIFKGKLYTADIHEMAIIDLESKKIVKIPVPGAKLLNDVEIDSQGNVYVSDTFGSKIYRIEAGTNKVEELVTLKEAPNGLLLIQERLYICGYGKAKADGTGMEDGSKGGLSFYDLNTKEVKSIIPDIGRIDGIQLLKDKSIVISVKVDEALYWVNISEGRISGTLRGMTSFAHFTDVADMGYDADSNTLYIPNTNMHNIQQIKLQ